MGLGSLLRSSSFPLLSRFNIGLQHCKILLLSLPLVLYTMASLLSTTAPFNLLPTDILLLIMEEISDFVSLDNLLAISPHAASIFLRWAIPITQRTLLTCLITSQLGNFQEVMVIRSGSARYANLGEFQASFWAEDARTVDLVQYFAGRDPSEVAVALRDMVRVAAHIQRIACTCLSKTMGNLYAAVNSNPVFPPSRELVGTVKPSWVEEYRVYRAVWHMQVYSDLERASGPNAVRRDPSPFHWGVGIGTGHPTTPTRRMDGTSRQETWAATCRMRFCRCPAFSRSCLAPRKAAFGLQLCGSRYALVRSTGLSGARRPFLAAPKSKKPGVNPSTLSDAKRR